MPVYSLNLTARSIQVLYKGVNGAARPPKIGPAETRGFQPQVDFCWTMPAEVKANSKLILSALWRSDRKMQRSCVCESTNIQLIPVFKNKVTFATKTGIILAVIFSITHYIFHLYILYIL